VAYEVGLCRIRRESLKKQDMIDVIQGTPEMMPVFRVVKVSKSLTRLGVEKGDTFYRYLEGCWVPLESKCKFNPELSYGQIEFVGYFDRKPQRLRDMGLTR